MKEQAKPLLVEEFRALLTPLRSGDETVGLAISGGADSLALALCAKRAGIPCVAFIVDHALRPESGEEAQTVQKRLAAIGLEAEILRWNHAEVSSRLHVQARKARYALLAQACKQRGISALLVAHHRDDQAETILMRLAKGSGIGGLSGMAAVYDYEGLRLLRPFLTVSKARLVATCQAAGQAFVIDPSNESEKYARGRLRRVSEVLAQEGLTTERLIDLGERAAEAAQAIDCYAHAFLRAATTLGGGGLLRLNVEALRQEPKAVGLKALAACLQAIHTTPYAPERRPLLAVYDFLLNQSEAEARTFHGVVLQKNKDGTVVSLIRESGHIVQVQPIAPGQTVLWDGRWRVTLRGTEEGLVVRALGQQSRDVWGALAPGLHRLVPQGRARAALPALWRGEDLVLIPAFSEENQAVAYALVDKLPWS